MGVNHPCQTDSHCPTLMSSGYALCHYRPSFASAEYSIEIRLPCAELKVVGIHLYSSERLIIWD